MMAEVSTFDLHSILLAARVEYSALSWNGFNLVGDAKSIAEVKRLIGVEARVNALEQRLSEQSFALENALQQEENLFQEKWI